jgi:hypothetical protein
VVYYLKPFKTLSAQIHNVNVTFFGDCKGSIMDFIERDFSFFKTNDDNNPDISVEIVHGNFQIPPKSAYYSNNIVSYDDTIAVKYNARFREIWVTYSTKPYLGKKIKIFIPSNIILDNVKSKVKEKIIRILFPNFLYRWQNALVDIIHGPLLGVIHLRLLYKGAALLHSSAIANEQGNGVLLPGWAQSGKSTIADILIKKKSWKFIGEDICIVTKEGMLIPFPKQRRVYYPELKNTKYFKFKKSRVDLFEERLNIFLFRILSLVGLKSKRLLTYREVYDESSMAATCSELNALVYISRGKYDDIFMYKIKEDKVAAICTNMMVSEMQNFNGFYQLLAVYGMMSDNCNPIQDLIKSTSENYLAAFKDKRCYILNAPYFKDFDFIEKLIHPKLEEVLRK